MIPSTEATTTYVLRIYAKPKNHQNGIDNWLLEKGKQILQVRVTAPPEAGKANKAIIALLAERLGIAQHRIILISGATSRYKTFKITAWTLALEKKLPLPIRLPTLFHPE